MARDCLFYNPLWTESNLADPVTSPSTQPSPLARGVGAVVVGVTMFFAVWAVIETVATAVGGSLNGIQLGLLLALGAAVAAAATEYRRGDDFPVAAGGGIRATAAGGTELALAVLGMAALAAMVMLPSGLTASWLAAVVVAGGALAIARDPGVCSVAGAEHGRRDALILLVCIVVAVAATVLSNRTDDDDTRYLFMAGRLLQAPDQPIFSQIWPGGSEHIYRWHPYEALQAGLARLNVVSLLTLYYWWLPALHAGMVVLVLYLCARPFVGVDAALAAAAAVVMLLAWGDIHRSTGNFAFVRLFQGKAALASWGLPLVTLTAMRWVRQPSVWAGLGLGACLIACFGLGHTALVVAPMAAVLGGLAAWPRPLGRCALAVASLCLVFPFVVVMGAEMAAKGYLRPSPKAAADALALVFPPNWHSLWALAATTVAGMLLGGAGGVMARRMVPLGLVLIINPVLLAYLGRMAESLSWRILWAYPFTVMAAVAVIALARFERARARPPLLAAAALTGFLVAGPWTLSGATGNHFGSLDAKLSSEFSVPLQKVIRWLGGVNAAAPLLYGTEGGDAR